jgi:Trypsin-like peptidase domain
MSRPLWERIAMRMRAAFGSGMVDEAWKHSFSMRPVPPNDSPLRIVPTPVGNPHVPSLVAVTNPEFSNGIVLLVGFLDDADFRIEGTAVMVAPATALSASHVLVPRLEDAMKRGLHPMAIGISPLGLQMWDIRTVSLVSVTDLALLGLVPRFELSSAYTMYTAQMTTRMPNIGERIEIYGYRASADAFPLDANAACIADGRFILSPGLVTNVYPERRDSSMLNWPCFEVDCPTFGGMSGGPAFDRSGRLIGLLCSSFGSPDDLAGPSYVSLIWHALTARITSSWPEGLIPPNVCLLEMGPELRFIERQESINIVGADTDNLSWTINRWS